METIDNILRKSDKGTSTKPLIGIDLFPAPFSMLSGTLVTGVTVFYTEKGVQLNFGAVTNNGFIYGIADRSARKFYPGRILSDKTGAASFIPGLDFKDRFIPGAVRGKWFVPGVYYTGAFIPGIYRDDVFLPGTINPDGFNELHDPSEIGMLLMWGNPYNWDLSEDVSLVKTSESKSVWETLHDLYDQKKEKVPDKTVLVEKAPYNPREMEESAQEGITNRFQIPVGYGNGSKPPPGEGWDGPTLPGHSESIAEERERSKYDMLDFDNDGKPNYGWRILDPRMSPTIPGESATFGFDKNEKDDFDSVGENVGVGMGSEGGGIHLPKITGNPEEDAKRILGGIDPTKCNRIQLGDPGPEQVVDLVVGFFIASAAFMSVGLGIYVGVTYVRPWLDEKLGPVNPEPPP